MTLNGSPKDVFAFMDNIENTGKHMTKKNAAMMGSKLDMEWLTVYKTGLGTKYRWKGKAMGMKMDFTVEVSKWIDGREKTWGTVGNAIMIVISWFEMYLNVMPAAGDKTIARLGIYYTKPRRSILGFLFGRWYAKWCVNSMLKDTRKHFDKIRKDEKI